MNYQPTVTALAAFALLSLNSASSPSYASEAELSVGRGFICNTENEVEAAITPDEGKIKAHLANVNSRFGKDSCTFATALFEKAGDEKDVLTGEGNARVQKVKLVGYLVGDELKQIAAPKDQFFGVSENDVGA
jgi:hypothetical protein